MSVPAAIARFYTLAYLRDGSSQRAKEVEQRELRACHLNPATPRVSLSCPPAPSSPRGLRPVYPLSVFYDN